MICPEVFSANSLARKSFVISALISSEAFLHSNLAVHSCCIFLEGSQHHYHSAHLCWPGREEGSVRK